MTTTARIEAPAIEAAAVRRLLGRVARTVGALADQVNNGGPELPRWVRCADLAAAAAAGRRDLRALPSTLSDESHVIEASAMLAAVVALVAMAAPEATTPTEASDYLLDADAYVDAALWAAWTLKDRYAGLTEGKAESEPDAAEATEAVERPRAEERGGGDVARLLNAIDLALHMVRIKNDQHTLASTVAFELALALGAPDDVTYCLQAAMSDDTFGELRGYEIMLFTARLHLEEWEERGEPVVG